MEEGRTMQAFPGLYLVFLPLLFSCSGEVAPTTSIQLKQVEVPVFNKQNVSSSRRSKAVVTRVAPMLVKDLQAQSLSYGSPVFIRIFKEERELEVWLRAGDRFQLFRTYSIAAMSGKLGPKLQEGDGQAPEGFYFVPPSHMNPKSRFHLSFNLGYPNAYDRAHGRTGSALMVHGGQASVGCFAMTDPKVEEIYALAEAALRNGQRFFRVHSFPFRMTDGNLARHADSRWKPFWTNLKEGYDFFEDSGLPPDVVVSNKRYSFKDSVY